jgi:hypothetical protein
MPYVWRFNGTPRQAIFLKQIVTKDMKLIGTIFWLGSFFSKWQKLLVISVVAAALGACGGGGGGGSVAPAATPTPATYTIGGSVIGLSGTLILQNNGGNNLNLSGDGSFSFSKALASGATYSVTVLTQPNGQNCTVSSDSGTATATATANVTTVAIQCTYTVGGTVSGLSGTLILQNNGGDNLNLSGDGSFSFSKALASGSAYAVTVLTQPSGENCTVSNDRSTATANVTTVAVQCAVVPVPVTYTIGGTVSGLNGTVVLQNNGGDDLALSVSGSFSFSKALASGAAYTVTVLTQPSGQNCTASSGSGTATANVNTVAVQCALLWTGTKQLGVGVAAANTSGNSVATDASGNVYVVGTTNGGLDRNTQTGTYDFFVTKYNSSGVKQFTRQLGVAGTVTLGSSAATDASGNVYVAGTTYGGLDGNTLNSKMSAKSDFFFTKYDSNGVKQYTRQLGVAGASTWGYSVATDASGNVYVAGTTFGGLDGNTLTGGQDFFVTKYDSSGVKQYTRLLGVAPTNRVSVATDASGNVYMAGGTIGGLDGNTLTGYSDFFVTKYDGGGVKQYTRQLGVTAAATWGSAVTTDASGNVYVVGSTSGALDGNPLTGGQDFFVTKYDSSGVKQYTRQLGATRASTYGSSITADASSNVYVAGYTNGELDGNTRMGTYDFFVTKFNSSGVKQYTRQLGVTGADTSGFSVATDASSNVYVAGTTTGGLDGNTRMGPTDFFVTKYNSSGVKQ